MAATAAHYERADKPIVDQSGRTRVIIDFFDDAHKSYSLELFANYDPKVINHDPRTLQLVTDYEKQYGFSRVLMTSWVGNSVTAFLRPEQVERLSQDAKVRLLSDDTVITLSSNPPWYPSWNGTAWGELYDWGRNAVNGKVASGSSRRVYIIDSGVAYHSDLGNVSSRVNVGCGTGNDCSGVPYPNYTGNYVVGYYSTVGCYAHSTHVAGIIGATDGNSLNRAGVYAGVDMISIALGNSPSFEPLPPGETNPAWTPCAGGSTSANQTTYASAIGSAFDYIYNRNMPWYGGNGYTHIVNMSINPGRVGFLANGNADTNRTKLLNMVTPATVYQYGSPQWNVPRDYKGMVFVQSAGNQNVDLCTSINTGQSLAFTTSLYPTTTAIDGIMVVGAINSAGAPVSNANPIYFTGTTPVGLTDPTLGSNYGSCVDIWAPGDQIYSTWGSGPASTRRNDSAGNIITYSGGQPSTYMYPNPVADDWLGYSGWAWLSGTSMAAPHVAAAAAYIADRFGLNSPADIESAVRSHALNYCGNASWGASVPVVCLPN